jgi:hypothetical protein
VLIALVSQSRAAWAGGIRVKKWLDLPELTKKSSVIVLGRVLSTSHVLHSRRAYGGRRFIYMAVFRVHVKVEEVLHGPQRLKGKKALLTKTIYGVPGAWIIVDKSYRSGLSPGKVKVGSRLLAFVLRSNKKGLRWPSKKAGRTGPRRKQRVKAKTAKQKMPWIQAFALEHTQKTKKVKSLVKALKKRSSGK